MAGIDSSENSPRNGFRRCGATSTSRSRVPAMPIWMPIHTRAATISRAMVPPLPCARWRQTIPTQHEETDRCNTHLRRTSRSTGSSASRRRRAGAAWWSPRRRARRRPASRCWTPAAMRSTRRWRPRWRSPRMSRGTPASAASASRWCTAPARSAPRWWISAPCAGRHRSRRRYKLTGRMTTDLFAWPEVEGDINIHGPLSVAIPSSVAGYDYMHRQWGRLPLADVIAPAIALAKRGLPQDWYTALKVVTSAPAIRLYPHTARGLPAERPAAGAALPGQARLLPPGQPARHAGASRPGRAARLLRRRDRRLGRRRHQGAGWRAVARGSARLPGAHLAGGGGRLARPHVAAHRRAHRRADAEARAGGHGRCALWRRRRRPTGTARSPG